MISRSAMFPTILTFLMSTTSICCGKDRLRYQASRPAVFPDNSRVLFGSDHESDGDIYSIAPDGSNLTRLTNGPGIKGCPAVSPDAKTIVYSVQPPDSKGEQLYTMAVDGTNVVRIASNQFSDTAPSYSPDGKKIVFARAVRYRPYSMGGMVWDDWDVWLMNADGSGEQQLTYNRYNGIEPPYFSPDGKQIVFGATARHPLADHLYIFDIDAQGNTNNFRELKVAAANPPIEAPRDPSFSPDASQIVFDASGLPPNDYDSETWAMHLDGSGLTQLTHNKSMNEFPMFSRDGKVVYFLSDPKRNGARELWRINTDATGARQLFPKDAR